MKTKILQKIIKFYKRKEQNNRTKNNNMRATIKLLLKTNLLFNEIIIKYDLINYTKLIKYKKITFINQQ